VEPNHRREKKEPNKKNKDMLEEFLTFVSDNQIPIFLLHGITEQGKCTCKGDACTSAGKHPYAKISWKSSAKYDRKTTNKLSKKVGELNLAAATGRKGSNGKYLVVVDIDDPKSDLIEKLLIEKTFSYRTGGGGLHFWFWSDVSIKNSVSLLAKKVDIRGTNGYVAVPPSKHVTGNKYEILPDSAFIVKDLPEWLREPLTAKRKIEQKNEKKQVKKQEPVEKIEALPKELQKWALKEVREIRQELSEGGKIPQGIRNQCLHRLLSSDRARGVYEKEDLEKNAYAYAASFEEKMDDGEIQRTVASVMRYPAHNNSHEKVNTMYIKWLSKTKKPAEEGFSDKLVALDTAFFEAIELLDGSAGGVSLQDISDMRVRFLRSKGLDRFSTYKPCLLGKKLRELGAKRLRTSSKNLWLISLEKISDMCYEEIESAKVCETTPIEEPKESKEKMTEEADTTVTPVTVTEKKVKIKIKKHPFEWKYPGDIHADFMRDQVSAFGIMSEEEYDGYFNPDVLLDEEEVDFFLSEVAVGDKIGVGYKTFLVLEKRDNGLLCENKSIKKSGDEEDSYFLDKKEIDKAIPLDRADILYRDNKPYGQPEYEEITLKVVESKDTDDTSQGAGQP